MSIPLYRFEPQSGEKLPTVKVVVNEDWDFRVVLDQDECMVAIYTSFTEHLGSSTQEALYDLLLDYPDEDVPADVKALRLEFFPLVEKIGDLLWDIAEKGEDAECWRPTRPASPFGADLFAVA